MSSIHFKRLVGSIAAGALALSGFSLGVAAPAHASPTPPAAGVTTLVSNIRPNEDTYKGWHQGYNKGSTSYFVGWDGVHLGGGEQSQIINGLVDTNAPGLPIAGNDLLGLITGSTVSVASGEVYAQVAVTTKAGWGTLRPAAPAKTPAQPKSGDAWVSSKTIGSLAADTPTPLKDIITTLDSQTDLRYSAYGFLSVAQTPLAVVKSMTWGTDTFTFGPSVTAIAKASTVQVTGPDIRPNEATYPGWHEGYTNESAAFSVKADGLHIGDGANSQVINGLATPTKDPDLRSLITSSQLKVVSGAVSFQVPLYYGSVATPLFTTIRPASNAGPGTTGFALVDEWVSSKAISATAVTPAIAAGTAVALGDLIDAIQAHTSVQLLAFGVLATSGTPSVVDSITWNGVTYSFLASATKTTLTGGNASSFGADVTYTATVSALAPGGSTPTGSVEFWADATKVGTADLVKGSASFTVKDLLVGTTTITAKFLGSDSFTASSVKSTQTVTPATTSITVPTPTGTLVGSDVVLTATVKSEVGVPTGSVQFSVNDDKATSVALVDGKASFTVTKVTVGVTRVIAEYLGDATHADSSVVTDITVAFPSAVGTADQKYITRVYRDLFGRDPEPAGLTGWTAKLATGTPRGAVADGITYSTEYRSGLIRDAYAQYLGRTPDAAGLQGWLKAMDNGMTLAQMESGFIASPEYYADCGGTDWAWVGQLYSDVLGRSATNDEVKAWVQRLALGASRQQVSMGFLLSTEHLNTVVDGHYVTLLHRHLDPTGQAGWVRALQAGGRDEAIISGIVASAEYYSMS